MRRRKLLKDQDRHRLFSVPTDEDSLIRHYSLSSADRPEIGLRRREHNRLGFAVQLCLMRHPGRVLAAGETSPRAMLKYVADQVGADLGTFALYARREENPSRPRRALDDVSGYEERNGGGPSSGATGCDSSGNNPDDSVGIAKSHRGVFSGTRFPASGDRDGRANRTRGPLDCTSAGRESAHRRNFGRYASIIG